MTAATIIVGLMPILFGTGTVSRQAAHRSSHGRVTTTLLCLLVLPVIDGIYLQMVERRHRKSAWKVTKKQIVPWQEFRRELSSFTSKSCWSIG